MKPKIKGRDWWGSRLKNSWSGQNKMHSSRKKMLEMNKQVESFIEGESIGETKESFQSEES